MAQLSPILADLAADPVLHQNRVRIVAPSRVKHSLFATSSQGIALRPTIKDLISRGVVRGFGIERRLRMGAYFYSRNVMFFTQNSGYNSENHRVIPQSIVQYENGLRLARRHASDVISTQLRRHSARDKFMNSISHVLPDTESASPTISRMLLPAIHQLKWSIQRDRISRLVKFEFFGSPNGVSFGSWYEKRGHGIIEDGERVRLAICPDVKKTVKFYEGLTQAPSYLSLYP